MWSGKLKKVFLRICNISIFGNLWQFCNFLQFLTICGIFGDFFIIWFFANFYVLQILSVFAIFAIFAIFFLFHYINLPVVAFLTKLGNEPESFGFYH